MTHVLCLHRSKPTDQIVHIDSTWYFNIVIFGGLFYDLPTLHGINLAYDSRVRQPQDGYLNTHIL